MAGQVLKERNARFSTSSLCKKTLSPPNPTRHILPSFLVLRALLLFLARTPTHPERLTHCISSGLARTERKRERRRQAFLCSVLPSKPDHPSFFSSFESCFSL